MGYEHIPLELQERKQWTNWREELTDTGKPTKVPYMPNGRKSSSINPETWSTFADAVAAAPGFNGIGFYFSLGDPYTGIDLDVKPDTDAEAMAKLVGIYDKMDSYSETSPSGLGLHIIVKARVKVGRRREGVEVYSDGRYFTFTGNVYGGRNVINERQELVDILVSQMGVASSVNENHYDGKPTQTEDDEALFTRICGAENGEKFKRLWGGNLADYNGNHSAADQALMNFLAYHSGHKPQMIRMFRSSVLGERIKAMRQDYIERTIIKAFDLTLPPIDFAEAFNNMQLAKAGDTSLPDASLAPIGHDLADSDPVGAPHIVDGFDLDIWRRVDPPYAMKLIMDYTLASAPYPVREMGLCASLALMAGICGRAYNVSNTGLNLYIMVVAATGRGKDAMAGAIDQIFASVANNGEFPSIMTFAGPRTAASGAGLERFLSEMPIPSCLTVTGEIGIKLKRMSSENASPAEEQLKGTILELFTKSRHGAVYRQQVHADKKNNIEGITSPAWSWLGEGVPSTFYQSLTEAHVSEGLIPRFLIVDYLGGRVDYNANHANAKVSPELMHVIKVLGETSLQLNQQQRVNVVPLTKEAFEATEHIRIYVDKTKINQIQDEIILALWNRHHLKVLKISALLAIAHEPINPLIDAGMVMWANSLCMTDTFNIMGKFERGEIGHEDATTFDDAQITHVKKIIWRFMRQEILRDTTSQAHWLLGCFTRSMIMTQCNNHKAFKDDRQGLIKAMDKILAEFVKNGWVQKLNIDDTMKHFNSKAETYKVINQVAFQQ